MTFLTKFVLVALEMVSIALRYQVVELVLAKILLGGLFLCNEVNITDIDAKKVCMMISLSMLMTTSKPSIQLVKSPIQQIVVGF